jgi:hypothetical protein
VAGSFDGTHYAFYVNGDLDSAGANATTISGIVVANIGRNPATSGEFFNGSIADVATWFQILSPGDIRRLAKERLPSRFLRGTASTTFFNLPLQGASPETEISDTPASWTLNGGVFMADGPGADEAGMGLPLFNMRGTISAGPTFNSRMLLVFQ